MVHNVTQTWKRESEEDKDDELPQEETPTQEIKDISDDEEDEDALLGNSDEEDNQDDTELTDGLLEETTGGEFGEGGGVPSTPVSELDSHEDTPAIQGGGADSDSRLEENVDASESLELCGNTGDILNINVVEESLVDDLTLTAENHSFASQQTMDIVSSSPLTTPKSVEPKPSPPRSEETLVVEADTSGLDKDGRGGRGGGGVPATSVSELDIHEDTPSVQAIIEGADSASRPSTSVASPSHCQSKSTDSASSSATRVPEKGSRKRSYDKFLQEETKSCKLESELKEAECEKISLEKKKISLEMKKISLEKKKISLEKEKISLENEKKKGEKSTYTVKIDFKIDFGKNVE